MHSLNISLHGMNSRMQKMMVSYLESSCNGLAQVVEESQSLVEIVDFDVAHANSLLKERMAQQPPKPIIVLSLEKVSIKNVIYVKKPIEADCVINALKTAKNNLLNYKTTHSKSNNSNTANKASRHKSAKRPKKKLKPNIKNTGKLENTSTTPLANTITLEQSSGLTNEPVTTPSIHSSAASKPENLLPANSSAKIQDPAKSKINSEQKTSKSFSIYILEIDRLLKELQHPFKKPFSSDKKKGISEQKNERKTIRYSFAPIEANLNKKSLTRNKNFTVLISNLSSRGALIELQNPSKLQGKVTLSIQVDTQHTFVIPARIARNEGKTTFGLQFLKPQHDLIDLLINSGHSFFF